MRTIVVGDVATAQRVVRGPAPPPRTTGTGSIGRLRARPSTSVPVDGVPVLGAIADVVQVVVDHAADVVVVGAGSTCGGDALRRLSLGARPRRCAARRRAGPRRGRRPAPHGAADRRAVPARGRGRRAAARGSSPSPCSTSRSALVAAARRAAGRAGGGWRSCGPRPPGGRSSARRASGVDGRRFTMWKLRTMYVDADERRDGPAARAARATGVLFKMRQDPRVTPVGRRAAPVLARRAAAAVERRARRHVARRPAPAARVRGRRRTTTRCTAGCTSSPD